MSKLDKRAISTLVIAILALSFVLPLASVSALLADPTLATSGVKGETITVTGGLVTSGATVELYWDTAMGDDAILLNSTTGKKDGSYSVNFYVPEAVIGEHFVWVKDVSGPYYASALFMVDSVVKLSPDSGLPTDKVTVKGYGFSAETKIKIEMDELTVDPEVIGTTATDIKTYAGFLTNVPVIDGAITIAAGAVDFTGGPAGDGVVTLTASDGVGGTGSGSVTLATGEWNIDFGTITAPSAADPIIATYTWAGFIIEDSDTFKTDELGSFTKEFVVPSLLYGDYHITANKTLAAVFETFTVGASISITPEEGPTGTVVTVEGRGWTHLAIMSFKLGTEPAIVVDEVEVKVDSDGEFSADVVIPGNVAEGEGKLYAKETVTVELSSVDFDVTGLPEIVVSPTYGSPGATISVTGSNFTQISGTKVVIELRDKNEVTKVSDLVTAETNSDGTFEDTFISPAVAFIGYDVNAEDTVYNIDTLDAFKVGLIAMIINPTHGSAGKKVIVTGIGFYSDETSYLGDFNMTFDEKLYEYPGGVKSEAISTDFYVPNVELGTYDVTVIDEDENELTVQFEVTAVTEVILDPAKAPNDYNVTIEGYNFADYEDLVDFILYNATDEWEMDVDYEGDPVKTGADGNFTGYWKVDPGADLSLGDYTMNVTGHDDFLLQVPFSVVEARVSVAPRKAIFDRGDTIQFNVKNDFDFEDSYMKIWDPFDNLYWRTEDFEDWLKVGDVYTVPYYLQTSGMNPMTLAQDAPLGTWFYVFYEEGTTQLTNGTFVVGPSASAQVDQKLTEIWASMEGITENIDSITEEISGDINALSGDIADVGAEVEGMKDDIGDLAEELAGVATVDALSEFEDEVTDSIGDIATAQNALQSELEDMGQDTAAAEQAANDARDSVQGLTTIVYGAIACSLIAALAAVVSLMQISKKIA